MHDSRQSSIVVSAVRSEFRELGCFVDSVFSGYPMHLPARKLSVEPLGIPNPAFLEGCRHPNLDEAGGLCANPVAVLLSVCSCRYDNDQLLLCKLEREAAQREIEVVTIRTRVARPWMQ